MAGILYSKELTCPLCENGFKTKRVRNSKTVLEEKDSDFCPYYKSDQNPIFYTPVICPKCGYGALKDNFDEITDEQKVLVLKKITKGWDGKDFGGIRSTAEATRSYEHVLKNAEVVERKASSLGKISHRLAWCHRYQDSNREDRFLDQAATYYKQAYEKEKLSEINLDAVSLLYLIGELNRRLGNYDKALKNFSNVIEHPDRHEKPRIEKLTRDQWQLTKDEMEE